MKYFLIFIWLAAGQQIRVDPVGTFTTADSCSTEQHRQEFLHKTDVVILSACTRTDDMDGTIIFKMNIK
jgi:hypothetical protein